MKKTILSLFLFGFLLFFNNQVFAARTSSEALEVGGCAADSTVWAVAQGSDGTTYVGGAFTTFCGQPRNYLAAIDANGNLLPWNPDADSAVYSLAVSGPTVYVGGSFTMVGGQERRMLASVDAVTGALTSWNPNSSGVIYSLALNGSNLYIAGDFVSIGGVSRNMIASFDITTGLLTNWNPNANMPVYSLAVSGSTVYVGGDFTFIGGKARNHIAALNSSTGLARSWNPDANSTVNAVAVSGNNVYIGGIFSSVGGFPREGITALDSVTGLPVWGKKIRVRSGEKVFGLSVSGNNVYVVGNFTLIGGVARNKIAALNVNNGSVRAWNPDAGADTEYYGYAVLANSSKVYVGGNFVTIGGVSQPYFATFSPAPASLR